MSRGGIYTGIDLNVSDKDRHDAEMVDRMEEGARSLSSRGPGPGTKTVFDKSAGQILINYDELAYDEKKAVGDLRKGHLPRVLSPKIIQRSVRRPDGKLVKITDAKLYEDGEWGAVYNGIHCGFCDVMYETPENPSWAVTFIEQKCSTCRAPRGRQALESSPIKFGPISSIPKSNFKEERPSEPWNTSVQARQSRWESIYRSQSRNG